MNAEQLLDIGGNALYYGSGAAIGGAALYGANAAINPLASRPSILGNVAGNALGAGTGYMLAGMATNNPYAKIGAGIAGGLAGGYLSDRVFDRADPNQGLNPDVVQMRDNNQQYSQALAQLQQDPAIAKKMQAIALMNQHMDSN